ncbi:MAG: ATP-binding protein, partial [Eudoraea sp.]|nr:ATP-binding protein [Eudoraea sp.]
YVQLLNKIEKFNTDEDHSDNHFEGHNFGKKGLYREISQLAHYSINSESHVSRYPLRFLQFYGSEKIDSNTDESQAKKSIDEAQKRVANAIGRKFKIIAIKPLENCPQEYLKILKKNQIYYFENAFDITDQGIYYDREKNIALFNSEQIKINVTAIVGKNGSGKSSLIELFFRTINNIAFLSNDKSLTPNLEFENDLAVELFYIIGGHLISLKLNNRSLQIQEYELQDSIYKKDGPSRKFLSSDLKKFFFTSAINYSHYSLNSKYLGKWVDHYFHKNDAYQTPLIINPNRIEGNIDINLENELIKSQLLSNLFDSVDDDDIGIRQITEYQKAVAVEFKLKATNNANVHMDKKRDSGLYIQKSDRDEIFNLIYEHFNFHNKRYSKRFKAVQEAEKFILWKLASISNTHIKYAKYYNDKGRSPRFNKRLLSEYILELREDSSHITYELKQAINYLNFYDLIPKAKSFTLQLDELSNQKSHEFTRWPGIESKELVEILPPPIFEVSIKLINNQNVNSDFDLLSSGEKQQIHAISTILYHLRNLDKLIADKAIPYSKVNLLFDEIELYYHPEMQKRYLNYMLNMIKKMAFNNIDAINICLVTHSPYILSDIPGFFTLQLKDGQPLRSTNKTFGANIHDLLANDFFMEDGFMGEFAKSRIEETIHILNNLISQGEELKQLESDLEQSSTVDKKELEDQMHSIENIINQLKSKRQSIRNVISLIGETVIKNKMEDMFRLAFQKEDHKEMTKNKILELAAREDIKITFTDN